MRPRPFVAMTIAAVTALLLAGCASGSAPDPSATSAGSSDALCAAAAPSGPASESVSVEGEFGEVPTASFATPVEVAALERTVVLEGDGVALAAGSHVSYALTVFDGTSGAQLDAAGYGDDVLPALALEVGTGVDEFFGCATAGSRIVLAVPGQEANPAEVYVLDVLEVTPAEQWCQIVDADAAMPTVVFDDAGVPTITIPDSGPPSGVVVETLEEGDGAVVESGDSVTLNYTGVKWSDGSVFDSSWQAGTPATFATTQVVSGFQRAIEGQKVGSTVLVSMSPECGYGEASAANSSALAGETLVFVVNIISSEPAAG